MNQRNPHRQTSALDTLTFTRPLLSLWLLLICMPACATINVCIEDRDNSPYIRMDQSGLLNQLVDAAASKIQQHVVYHPLPWKRCLTMVEQGAMDAALALVWNADRQARFSYPLTSGGEVDPSRRIWRGEYLIIVPEHSKLEWNGETFHNLEGGLGSPLGYASGDKLRAINAYGNDSPPDKGLLLVSKERLPGYVVQREIGIEILHRYGLSHKVKILPEPFMTEDWYLVFSSEFRQRSAATAEAMWQAIAAERQQLQSPLSAN